MDIVRFIQSIRDKKKVRVTFYSKSDDMEITRLCAPMDYGPSQKKNAKDLRDKFHLWDYESPGENPFHNLSLPSDQIVNIEYTDILFNPGEFVNWPTKWIVKRNWGVFS